MKLPDDMHSHVLECLQLKADSTRALKTRQLRRLTKRVAMPTELSNEEIYKYARSNLDERF
jgi:hypothetical protein